MPQGNDLRDLVAVDGWSAPKVFRYIMENCEEVPLNSPGSDPDSIPPPDIEIQECTSYNELMRIFKGSLEMTRNIEYTYLAMMATILSTRADGGQLAIRVLGPPGSVKSTLAECLSQDHRLVYPRSKFTGLVSGWGKIKKGEQLANKLHNRCMLVKDADTMIQLPNRKVVESELRDALGDGVIRAEYRNGQEIESFTRFTLILCGTIVLRSMDDSTMGSRFLDVVTHDQGTPTTRIVRKAMQSQYQTLSAALSGNNEQHKLKEMVDQLAPPSLGLLHHKLATIQEGVSLRPMTPEQEDAIHAMADYIACCRAKVVRVNGDSLVHRPEIELATRLSIQLERMAYFAALVKYTPEPTEAGLPEIKLGDYIIEFLRKITKDTAFGFPSEIALFLARKGREGASQPEISQRVELGQTQTWRVLEDMEALKLVTRRRVKNPHGRGQRAHYFVLTDRMRDIMHKAGLLRPTRRPKK